MKANSSPYGPVPLFLGLPKRWIQTKANCRIDTARLARD